MTISNSDTKLYTPSHQKGYSSSPTSEWTHVDDDIISRLANEVYREDLTPVIKDTPAYEKPLTIDQPRPEDTLPIDQPRPEVTQTKDNMLPPITSDPHQQHAESSYYFLFHLHPKTNPKHPSKYHMNNLDIYSIRKDFPILRKRVNGRSLVWLDNSATTQKPHDVIDALKTYYSESNSNVHRGAHTLARQATDAYESARKKIQQFIGASSPEEIIFVRGATEAINLVSQTYGNANIQEGDEILLTMMEHHSNIVPWQKLKESNGAVIKPIPINEHGEVILEDYEKLFTPRTKMVAIAHVSNVLGTVNPVRSMTEIAHKHGASVLIDGAQSVPHLGVNVSDLDADFYVFSGHKIYGPTGIGVLYGKRALLETMPPWQRGGGMIKDVSFDKTTYNGLPNKFEAGTGNIADAVALGRAIDYIQSIGIDRIEEHERVLTKYAMHALNEIPGVRLIGTSPSKTSVISFIVDGISSDSVARYLNGEGIAVRSGHHCAQPALRRFGLNSAVRASLGMYNTKEEIDCLVNAVRKISRS